MAGTRFVSPDQQFISFNGLPYAGGFLHFYASTTSTPQATFSDEALTIPNANPIELDTAGNAGSVFLSSGVRYKVVLTDAIGNEIWTFDPVVSFTTASATSYSWAGFAAGSANAIALTDANFTYGDGQVIGFIPISTNTATPTISVGGGPAVTVDVDLGSGPRLAPAGVIRQNNVVQIVYDHTNNLFHILNPFPNLNPKAPITLSGALADLGTASSNYVLVNGAGTLSSFGTSAGLAAPIFFVTFSGACTIVNSGNIVIPGSANIGTAAGDIAILAYQGSGVWDMLFYQSINQSPAGGGSAGQVAFFAMQTPPTGWLECNGALVSIPTHPALFAALGTLYGGDGVSNFRIPDLRGYFIRGWAHAGSIDAGRVFGSTQTDDAHIANSGLLVGATTAVGLGAGAGAAQGSNPIGGTETRPVNIALLPCIKT